MEPIKHWGENMDVAAINSNAVEMAKIILDLADSVEYWGEYDTPIGLKERIAEMADKLRVTE